MRKLLVFVSLFVGFAAFAQTRYSRAELERMSHAQLVDIILDLQGGGGGDEDCTSFDPLSGARPSILTFVNNPGYTNHGTLKWPNGEIFLRRNSGYTNDRTFYYPNGQTMRLRNSGYTNNGTMYWPNGRTMVLRNTGYTNNGTIYRADGSVWLLRNSGYTNDRTRYGLPIEAYEDGNVVVRGRLTDSDGVIARTLVYGDQWSIEVTMDSATEEVRVTECFRF